MRYYNKHMSKHIIAASTGYSFIDNQPKLGSVLKYGLSLTGKKTPKVCYLGTASGDAAEWVKAFYDACLNEAVTPSHIELFPMPNVDNIRDHILDQDMIWVGGGSLANLLALWRLHGLDEILREAWENGVVLTGVSAGSICWFNGGPSDSFGHKLQPITDGLGMLPYGNGVHFDQDPQRRSLLHKLVKEGVYVDAYATDEGVALHFVDDTLHAVIADVPEKYAYHIVELEGVIKEERLDARQLTDS